nr:MAG TPA: S-layer domain-containing protein Microbiome, Midwest Center for.1A [Caudoviricetes sp.]
MSEYLNLPKADYSSNLVAKWVFDDTDTSKVNGTTVYDLSGNGNNLTSYNVTYADDVDLGRCAYFNGSSSYMIGSSPILPIGEKSILIKFKIPSNTTTGMRIMSTCTWEDNGTILQHVYTTQSIAFYEREKNSYAVGTASSSKVCTDNTPYIMLFTNGNTLNNKGKVFQEDLSTNIANVIESTVLKTSAHSHNLVIGKQLKNNTEFLKGYIQSIEIYNKAIEYSDNAFLIKDNDKIYSFKDSEYVSPSYNEVTETLSKDMFLDKGEWNVGKLFTETTIDADTFKPKDKFTNPKLISYLSRDVKIQGLKSNKGMVVGRYSFSTRLAKNIDFFELVSTISDDSSIKMAVSVDTGTTWKVYNGTDWVDLTNNCPLKNYADMTDDEKTKWETFRDEVYTNGMDAKTLNTIDFNGIKDSSMMFAYVFDRNSYADTCEMSKLQYQFDANGSYRLLGNDEVQISQNASAISIVPKIDMDLVKVNVGSSGEVTINQGGGEIMITEEEYQKDWSEIFG